MNLLSLFKRPDDSSEWNCIFAASKLSIDTRKTQELPELSRGVISRWYRKFGDNNVATRHGIGAPYIDWGVLRHPTLNAGQPFTVRINRKDELIYVEAAPGEAWWLLTDRLWLGRRGTAPGLPKSLPMSSDEFTEEVELTAVEDVAMLLFIRSLAFDDETVDLSSLTYDTVSDFALKHNLSAEWWPDYYRMRFSLRSRGADYDVWAYNLDVSKEGAGGVRMSVERPRSVVVGSE
jgi:hypothetical protein